MKKIPISILIFVSAASMTLALAASPAPPPQKAEVLVLGTYHMANPGRDVFNMAADDVLSPKRQAEIAALVEVLMKFRPTKIAVESTVYEEKAQQRYEAFLAGKAELTRNEIDQIGFRMAKALGMKRIYPVDYDGEFPMQRVANYAKANGREAEWDRLRADIGGMVKRQDEFLKSHTILEMLIDMNSDAHAAEDVGYYFRQAHFGEPGDYAGPELLASWYLRNIRIFGNIAALAAPGERILVIYGAGHLGWLRQDVANDPTLKLRTLAEFVPAK